MSERKRIIVVEDDFTYLTLLSNFLTKAGYEVAAFTHGSIGLESFLRSPSDLVITDIFLPDIDGIDLIRAIRQDHPLAKIISMSAQSPTANVDHLAITLSLGCAYALKKPLNFHHLVELIEETLSSQAS